MVMVGAAALLLVAGIGTYLTFGLKPSSDAPEGKVIASQQAPQPVSPTPAAAGAGTVAATQVPPLQSGQLTVSALGLADPNDPRFKGNPEAAQAESRADAQRQLVEKVLGLYVEPNSLNKNYALLQQRLLTKPDGFIKALLMENSPTLGHDGLLETPTRAVLNAHDIQKSLNQLSKDERVDFIRNHGDPKVAIEMSLASADTAQEFPSLRSQLAENVLKERIKSFGFRVWSDSADAGAGKASSKADFLIRGEAKVKQLSAKLPASGLTITKTVLSSWTVKAIDQATGEEIYLNTMVPQGKSWANEDQALQDIGKTMGEEFSKGFFLQHFTYDVVVNRLHIRGLPDAKTAHAMLRELQSLRDVLDAALVSEDGSFSIQWVRGNSDAFIRDSILRPVNQKLGLECLTLTNSTDNDITVNFANSCLNATVLGKLEGLAPSGLFGAPDARRQLLLKTSLKSQV
jgi:serine/threonine-protein kinase